ncbi:YjeF N-terminal domain-containing protein, partial [Obelidium mucronatum]
TFPAATAQAIDAHLLSEGGFVLPQLMELAGLAVAEAALRVARPAAPGCTGALVVCGPGNNGGDGLHVPFAGAAGVRPPFVAVLAALKTLEGRVPLLSVDVPSGWDVARGNTSGLGVEPSALLSLTAPKECARFFAGRHFVGGRFVPDDVQRLFGVDVPAYEGSAQCVEIDPIKPC